MDIKCNYRLALLNSFVALLLLAQPATAAPRSRSYVLRPSDTANIFAEARKTIPVLAQKYNLLASAEGDADTKGIIAICFEPPTNIFLNEKFEVDFDLDPKTDKASGETRHMVDYLNEFNLDYKPNDQNKEGSITLNLLQYTPIKVTDRGKFYFYVMYSQFFDGVAKSNGSHFTKVFKKAQMMAFLEDGAWKTVISEIKNFDNTQQLDNGQNNADITNSELIIEKAPEKSDAYYKSCYLKGISALNEGNNVDAYRYLSEAGRSKAVKAQADKGRVDLKMKMNLNGDENNTKLIKGLSDRGADLMAKCKYDEAKIYYQCALDWDQSDTLIPEKIVFLNNKIAIEQKLAAQYEKGLYEQVIQDYSNAIADDPKNATLYLGRAKCYSKLGKNREQLCLQDFTNAIKLDPSNFDIYKWKGQHFVETTPPDYNKAYDCYAAGISAAADKNDPDLLQLYGNMAFAKGMTYERDNPQIAIDSLTSSLRYAPSAQVWLSLAKINFNKKNDMAAAMSATDSALKLEPEYPDAHYWRGLLLSRTTTGDHTAEAIKEMEKAISYNDKNGDWVFNLACLLQLRSGGSRQDYLIDAKKYFGQIIANKDQTRISSAYWYRGKCNYSLALYTEADADYTSYENLHPDKTNIPKIYYKDRADNFQKMNMSALEASYREKSK